MLYTVNNNVNTINNYLIYNYVLYPIKTFDISIKYYFKR